ncbi:MAG: hypothetical protein NW241_19025 [Bacteroidia bacterium]|nr:hypothetical protein [Bacteroidia bacterium]
MLFFHASAYVHGQEKCQNLDELTDLSANFSPAQVMKFMQARYGNQVIQPMALADYYKLVPTTVGGKFRDPIFGYEVKLVSQTISQLNSERNAWNADGTLTFFRTHTWKISIFDGKQGDKIREITFSNKEFPAGADGVAYIYWHPTNPRVLIYPKGNEIRGRNIDTNADFLITAFATGTIGTNGIKFCGGDGNEPSKKTNRLLLSFGDKNTNVLAYDFDRNAVATTALAGAAGSYRYETQFVPIQAGRREPSFNLGTMDYATLSPSGDYVVAMVEGRGTMLYDLSGKEIGMIYEVTPHTDLSYFNVNGKLMEGMIAKIIGRQADTYKMDTGDLTMICWEVEVDKATGKRTLKRYMYELLNWKGWEGVAGGGQHSANATDGSFSLVSMNPSKAVGGTKWGPYYDEIVELSMNNADPAPRRLLHHNVRVTSPVMKQPEAWMCPNGGGFFYKSHIGGLVPNGGEYLFYVKLPRRTCKDARADYLSTGRLPAAASGCKLTAPWQNADVGKPKLAGSACQTGTQFTLKASGWDIWNTSDQFHFVYQKLTGDGEVIARVNSVANIDEYTKAGVMVRNSLDANAANAMMYISPVGRWTYQRRLTAAGRTSSVKSNAGAVTTPHWVKLVRKGNEVTGYRSADGQTWTLVSSAVLTLSPEVFFGLALVSHDTLKEAEAVFDNVKVQTIAAAPSFELADFTATPQPELSRVMLDWATESEFNSTRFVVERSLDGVTFAPVAEVAAAGISGEIRAYEALDTKPVSGVSHYRLRMVDKANVITYSAVVKITYQPAFKGTVEVYPNPVKKGQNLNMKVVFPEDTQVEMAVRNLAGQTIWSFKGLIPKNNDQILTIGTSFLMTGSYFLTIKPLNTSAVYSQTIVINP